MSKRASCEVTVLKLRKGSSNSKKLMKRQKDGFQCCETRNGTARVQFMILVWSHSLLHLSLKHVMCFDQGFWVKSMMSQCCSNASVNLDLL